jgi:hypothetical protein
VPPTDPKYRELRYKDPVPKVVPLYRETARELTEPVATDPNPKL